MVIARDNAVLIRAELDQELIILPCELSAGVVTVVLLAFNCFNLFRSIHSVMVFASVLKFICVTFMYMRGFFLDFGVRRTSYLALFLAPSAALADFGVSAQQFPMHTLDHWRVGRVDSCGNGHAHAMWCWCIIDSVERPFHHTSR